MGTSGEKDFVIIVGGGQLTLPAYEVAREELGLGTVAFDFDPEAPGMDYADHAVQVSTKDVEACVTAARELSRRERVRGVVTCGADVEVTVAAVAEALGLPGVPVDVAKRCNDKLLMHRYLDEVGFEARARYRVVDDLGGAKEAASEVGFPCVLKPLANCASRGVQMIDSPDLVEEAYAEAVGWNGDLGGAVLVEEALMGSKHTVEMLAWQGEWHLLSIIDTHYISPRRPCETGLNTTTLSPEAQRKLFDFAIEVAGVMGVDWSAHKVDVNLSEKGEAKLVELTARLSGGFHCQYASPLAYGSHDIRAAVRLAVGQPFDPEDIRHRWSRGAAVKALFPEPGRIISIEGVDEALEQEGVRYVFLMAEEGDEVGPYLNSADRFAYVIADGETTAKAVGNAEAGARAIRIETGLVEESGQ